MKASAMFQALGRALMLPIAVLPVAGLLLRLGQADLVELGVMSAPAAALFAAAGGAIFGQLGLLFAIGVAVGFARDGNGAACLAGVVCYLVASEGAESFLTVPAMTGAVTPEARATLEAAWRAAAVHKFDVPLGIVSGMVGGLFYNRFAGIKLPEFLAFFGGRRFVPIISGLAGLVLAALLGLAYGPLDAAVDGLSRAVIQSGGVGLFLFGLFNRLLIVTGLHHILNNVVYFVVGDWHGTTGDLRRFFAGDPSAGAFMSGFFPVMMFGLPAACLAMYHEVPAERRRAMGGMFVSLVLTSVLTGITEPIEFSFMFVAPVLYGIHAVLTGLAAVVMDWLGVRLGYTFSAGLFDYVLNYGKSTRPLLLLPVGAAYALLYYGIFRFAIRRWNLPTPGRQASEGEGSRAAVSDRGQGFVTALGGAANLREVAACTTRLRLIVEDPAKVDEPALRSLGAVGILRPGPNSVQVVLGPVADAVAMDIQAALGRPAGQQPTATPGPEASAEALPSEIVRGVGGEANIASATRHPGRWRVEVRDPSAVSLDMLAAARVRGTASPEPTILHILVPSA